MEEHAVVRDLAQSREDLREFLMPGSRAGRPLPGHFPRSGVMKFLVDSRKRSAAVAVLSTAAALLFRGGRGPQSRWSHVGQALLPLLGTRRR
jgi:hypothetical protein